MRKLKSMWDVDARRDSRVKLQQMFIAVSKLYT
jgi:hypothetical protein